MNRKLMRTFQFAALALTAFGATMTVKAPEANAVVYCAAGVYRASCVARPVAAPTVNGVARRTARRTVSTLNDGSRQPSRVRAIVERNTEPDPGWGIGTCTCPYRTRLDRCGGTLAANPFPFGRSGLPYCGGGL